MKYTHKKNKWIYVVKRLSRSRSRGAGAEAENCIRGSQRAKAGFGAKEPLIWLPTSSQTSSGADSQMALSSVKRPTSKGGKVHFYDEECFFGNINLYCCWLFYCSSSSSDVYNKKAPPFNSYITMAVNKK